jgi:hypothetical protein
MSTKKPPGFEAFARKRKPTALLSRPPLASSAVLATEEDDGIVRRPQSQKEDRIRAPLRFTPAQWERVKQFAITERTSIQQLAIAGISRLLEEKGFPKL